jgi:hypothetical protein
MEDVARARRHCDIVRRLSNGEPTIRGKPMHQNILRVRAESVADTGARVTMLPGRQMFRLQVNSGIAKETALAEKVKGMGKCRTTVVTTIADRIADITVREVADKESVSGQEEERGRRRHMSD